MSNSEIEFAKAEMRAGRHDVALTNWRSILVTEPDNITALIGSGDCLMALKMHQGAVDVYAHAHQLRPDILPLVFALGTAEIAAGHVEQASVHLQQYLAQDNNNPHAHNNLALALTKLGDHDKARTHAEQAKALQQKSSTTTRKIRRKNPDDWQGLFDAGRRQIRQGEFGQARENFQGFLMTHPNDHHGWECLGISELGLGLAGNALKSLDMALTLKPEALGALHHRAIALRALGRLDEAVAACAELLRMDPGNVYAHSVRGAIYLEAGKILAAVPDLESAIAPNKDQTHDIGDSRPALQGALAYAYRALCRWDADYEETRASIIDNLSKPTGNAALMVISPFQVLPLGLSGEAQAEVARRASHKAATSIGVLPKIKKVMRNDMRLRIGYLSPDFCNHSVATALHEVIVCHDHQKFLVEGFSLGRTHDEITKKFSQDFDVLHDLSGLAHGQAAAFIAHRDIDILIELAGHTKGGRPEILAYKPAKLQISALGYGAPICADFIDYHLVDKELVPAATRKFYDEKLVDMPDCSLPASPPFSGASDLSRAEAGLPETSCLLANFGGSYKIDPFAFNAWMKILEGAPQAHLALLDNSDIVNDRLRNEASSRGVDPGRLVFVPFTDRAAHLARYAYVDLCLDTLTHNGGVTTTDALWQGAPVLTMRRDDMPDRMGPSLLTAAGLPELVAANADDFVRRAIEMAQNPDVLANLRQKVMSQHSAAPLFDTALYTKNLEAVLLDLWAKAVDNPFSDEK